MDVIQAATAASASTPNDLAEPVVTFKKRSAKNARKRPATPPPASDSGSEYSSQDEEGRTIKKRRKSGILTAASNAQRAEIGGGEEGEFGVTKFAADRSTSITQTNDATRQSNWYDETTPDALSSANLLGRTRSKPTPTEPSASGTYRGQAAYTSHITKNPDVLGRKQAGPVKAPTNVRTITMMDFAPDVCKDYKQTGFCGFGDSCKFLHAREDYKQGWELDREWEKVGDKRKAGKAVASANRGARTGDSSDDEDAALLEKIPFACVICKEPYKNPIVTRCGHYFCEACALKRYKKSPSCAACGAGTGGVFNGAKNLKRLLAKKRERSRRREEEEGEDSEGGRGDEQEDGDGP